MLASALSSHKTPTARDIPPVTLTNVQQVENADLKSYLLRVGPLYEQMRQLKDSEDNPWIIEQNPPEEFQTDSYKNGTQLLTTRKGSVASMTSINAAVRRPSYQRRGSSLGRKDLHDPPPLSKIPDVYFREDFHLENPRTFDVVSERSDVVPPKWPTCTARDAHTAPPRKVLATNAILQEKLSWYMDTVEMQLISSISTASTVLSSALISLQELHSQAAESVQEMTSLREDLDALDKEVVTEGLELLRKRRRLCNLLTLNDAVLQLKHILDGVAYSESLVDERNVDMALSAVDATEKLIVGDYGSTSGADTFKHLRLQDLSGAAALQGVISDLATLRSRIGKTFETRLHELLIEDLRHHVKTVTTEEVLLRWEACSLRTKGHQVREPPAYMRGTDGLRAALLSSIPGLHRARSLSTAIQSYRELVFRELRNVIRRQLPTSTDDADSATSTSTVGRGSARTDQEKSATLAWNIRAMSASEFERMLSAIFVGVSETLRRLKAQSSILLDVASAIPRSDGENQVKSPSLRQIDAIKSPVVTTSSFEMQEEIHAALDLSRLLIEAVDASQEKINRILRLRTEQSTNLPLANFLRYFTLNLFFANECESISGQAGMPLKNIVNAHAQGFIQTYAEKETQSLARGMAADNWPVKEFTAKDDEVLQQILECSSSNPPAWTQLNRICTSPAHETREESLSSDSTKANTTAAQGAIVEGKTFLLTDSAILCLEGMSRFLCLIGGIPSKTSEIATCLISYLQLFDSRCRQLILGAGALRSAGLKNITATHLSLSSQAASFVASIIPYIREFVRRHLTAGQLHASLMGEFDKVRRDFHEHQDAVYQKLVEIMSLRASTMAKRARETAWDEESVEDVRKYMVDLVKDTSKLHKALCRYLPEHALGVVVVPVFASYKEHLGNAYEETSLETETGREWYGL